MAKAEGLKPTLNPAPSSAKKHFPKSRRLLRHADFERVYKQGRRHFAPHLTVFYLLQEAEPGARGLRIGFTVGKALGGAVQRNRLKRRLREAVRLNLPANEPSADVVINPKVSLLKTQFEVVQGEIAAALQAIEKAFQKGKR